MKRELIGHCYVDSGQLMICDPCYVDSHWETKDFDVERILEDKEGNQVQYGKDFNHYEQELTKYGNKTVNQLIEEEILKKIKHKQTDEFNYDGVCRKTLTDKASGCVQNGIATVFSSGYGDGDYNVFAERDKAGRIIRVIIEMDELDEELKSELNGE